MFVCFQDKVPLCNSPGCLSLCWKGSPWTQRPAYLSAKCIIIVIKFTSGKISTNFVPEIRWEVKFLFMGISNDFSFYWEKLHFLIELLWNFVMSGGHYWGLNSHSALFSLWLPPLLYPVELIYSHLRATSFLGDTSQYLKTFFIFISGGRKVAWREARDATSPIHKKAPQRISSPKCQ